MPRTIRTAHDLGPGKPVLIYGAGQRGEDFLRGLRAQGLECRGFLDSFKPGEHGGLPVYRYADAPQDLLHASRIVIASFKHRAIARQLNMDGVADFLVLLDAGEELDEVLFANDLEETLELWSRKSTILGRQARSLPRKGAKHSCGYLDGGLWVGVDGLKYCCFMPDLVPCQPVPQLMQSLDALRQGIFRRIEEGRETCCSHCMFLAEVETRPEAFSLQQLNFGHNTVCNFKCSYCSTRRNQFPGSDGTVLRLVRGLAEAGMLHENLECAWAGEGEPVLDPDFEAVLGLLLAHSCKVLVFTNASVHSPLLEQGLRAGLIRTVTSLDAGTAKTFERMHGVDALDRVRATLQRYLAAGNAEAISLKYILGPDNTSDEELDQFVDLCRSLGAGQIIISSDYSLAANPYPAQAERLRRCAEAAGISVTFSTWTA